MTRHVVLVCGPPCAGKSTYVTDRRAAADLVVDFDDIAQALGSTEEWNHSPSVADAAEREMDRMLAAVAAIPDGVAWVVRCAADPIVRGQLADLVRADRVVVLLPPLGVLLKRARSRPQDRLTRSVIMRWKDEYSTRPGDELLRS